MSAAVRIFAHSAMVNAQVSAGHGRQLSGETVSMLKQPYLGRQALTVDTGTAQASSTSTTPAKTTLLLVQIQQGKSVHIEICPPGRAVTADTGSPIITGALNVFECGPSWTISVIEATL